MTNDTHHGNVRYIFFYLLLGAVATLTLFIFLPYFITLFMATAFAVVCQPLYQALRRITNNHDSIAAMCTVLLTGILVLAPLTLLVMQVLNESTALYEKFNEQQTFSGGFLTTVESTIEKYVHIYIPTFDLDLETLGKQSLGWISTRIGPIFTNTLQVFLHFVLGIIAFYYLVRDGEFFVERLVHLSPLQNKHDRTIFHRLVIAINSIVKGSLLIALIQGTVSGIGFAIFGVPSAILWGSAAAIGALIPGVGTAIVVAPAVMYLFFMGSTTSAIGLAIWGVIAVGMIDNFLGPVLLGRGVRIHPLLVLFSVIGGIEFFGPLGLVLGPIVLSLLFALLDIYQMMAAKSMRAA